MQKIASELPTDPKVVENEAEDVFVGEPENAINAVLILSQVDPLARNEDGSPKWSGDQHKLIMQAIEVVSGWEE